MEKHFFRSNSPVLAGVSFSSGHWEAAGRDRAKAVWGSLGLILSSEEQKIGGVLCCYATKGNTAADLCQLGQPIQTAGSFKWLCPLGTGPSSNKKKVSIQRPSMTQRKPGELCQGLVIVDSQNVEQGKTAKIT